MVDPGSWRPLRQVLRDARSGAGKAAVMRGEAGIGKTRLLGETLTHAGEEGFQVLSGTTDELARIDRSGP
ncbi:MAG TPA: ATP-binding protein [Pseudonocardiaceae bacterium]|nr:ATP-binding protein [Pseudonocardiaceae bacterium]